MDQVQKLSVWFGTVIVIIAAVILYMNPYFNLR